MPDDTHAVKAVHGSREWSSQHGQFVTYTVELDGLSGVHELNQKAGSAPPKVGDSLFGHAENGGNWPDGQPKPAKFKKAQQGSPNGGFRGVSPEQRNKENAAKGRCHAQHMALRYASIRQAQGNLPDEFKLNDLFRIADQFEADVRAAEGRA